MKRLLTIAASLGVATVAFGQGEINFANTAGATTKVSTSSAFPGVQAGSALTAGAGAYYYEIFWTTNTASLTSDTAASSLDPTLANGGFAELTGVQAQSTATAGRIAISAGGDSNGDAAIPGQGAGNTVDAVIVGWSASLGSSWTQVKADVDAVLLGGTSPVAGFYGESEVGSYILGGGSTPVPYALFGTAPAAPGFVLGALPVPEPATFALCGLGAAALVIFRRRN
jgi:hypothetical protein